MTVAQATFSLNAWGYGDVSDNDFGALGESTFTYESMEYKVYFSLRRGRNGYHRVATGYGSW